MTKKHDSKCFNMVQILESKVLPALKPEKYNQTENKRSTNSIEKHWIT